MSSLLPAAPAISAPPVFVDSSAPTSVDVDVTSHNCLYSPPTITMPSPVKQGLRVGQQSSQPHLFTPSYSLGIGRYGNESIPCTAAELYIMTMMENVRQHQIQQAVTLNNVLSLLQSVDLFCKGKTDECRVELPRVPCGKSSLSSADNQELLLMLRAQSQILGWLIVCIAAVTGLIGTCYKNCRSQVSYLQLKFWRKYIEKEKEQFDCYATEYATKLADRNLKSFFENTEPEAFPFPSHRSWVEISSLYTFCKSEQYYSTLQRTVEKGNKDKDDEMRCALHFVDGVEMM
ncbi:UNVERIFIED_CONTAM: hypothetical protein FKN15_043027 [Acipenser sinensis]